MLQSNNVKDKCGRVGFMITKVLFKKSLLTTMYSSPEKSYFLSCLKVIIGEKRGTNDNVFNDGQCDSCTIDSNI